MASSYNGAALNSHTNGINHDGGGEGGGGGGGRVTSKTAPARLEQLDDEDDADNILFKVRAYKLNRVILLLSALSLYSYLSSHKLS